MSLPIVFRVEAQAEFNRAFDWYEQQQRTTRPHPTILTGVAKSSPSIRNGSDWRFLQVWSQKKHN